MMNWKTPCFFPFAYLGSSFMHYLSSRMNGLNQRYLSNAFISMLDQLSRILG